VLQLVSVGLVIYSFFFIRTAIPALPGRIPMHFDAAGAPNGWGSPQSLWALFGAQAISCLVFLLIPYLGQAVPSAIHLGRKRLSDFREEQRPRVMAMLTDMAAYLNIVMNLFFAAILRQVVQAARQTPPQLHPVVPLVVLVICVAGIVIYYGVRFNSAAKGAKNNGAP